MAIISVGQITISDFNDIDISNTAPSSPATNQLWLDSSVVPNQLKRWDGSKWVIVNQQTGRNLLILSAPMLTGYLSASGVLTTSATWRVTDFIPVTGGQEYVASGYSSLGSSPSTCFYTSSKAFISGVAGASRRLVKAPATAAYMRFSFTAADSPTLKIEAGNQPTPWSPAPEDLENKVDNIVATVSQHTTAISQNTTDIGLRALSTEVEGKIYKQSTAPAHTNGRLWLDTSAAPNILKRSTGSAWVNVSPTKASEIGLTDTAITQKVQAAKNAQNEPLFALTSEVKQTVDTWTAKFSEIGGANILRGTNASDSFYAYGSASSSQPEEGVKRVDSTAATTGVLGLQQGGAYRETKLTTGATYTLSFEVRGTKDPVSYVYLINEGQANVNISSKRVDTNTLSPSQFTKRIFTFDALAASGDATYTYPIIAYNGTKTTSDWMEIRGVQLEAGEVANDWTQHPNELITGRTQINRDGIVVARSDALTETYMQAEGVVIRSATDQRDLLRITEDESQFTTILADQVFSNSVTRKVGKHSFIFETVRGYVTPTGTGEGSSPSDPADSIDTAIKTATNRAKFLDNADIIIYVGAGSYNDWTRIMGYTGAGELKVVFGDAAFNPGVVKMTGNIDIYDCSCRVTLNSAAGKFVLTTGTLKSAITIRNCSYVALERPVIVHASDEGYPVHIESSRVSVSSYDFLGNGTLHPKYGIYADYNSQVYAMFGKGNTRLAAFFSDRGSILTAYQGIPRATSGVAASAANGQYFSNATSVQDSGTTPPTASWATQVKTFDAALTRVTVGTGWRTENAFVQGRSPNLDKAYYGEASFGSEIYAYLRNNGGYQNLSKIEIIRHRGGWGYGDVALKISSPYALTLPAQARNSTAVSTVSTGSSLGVNIRDSTDLTLKTSTTTTADYADFSRIAIRITVQKRV